MSDCVGIDQSTTASEACLAFATNKLGQAPVFWGRYFKAAGNTDPAQYQSGSESSFFSTNRIRVLPIGRQTSHVSRPDRDLGFDDGQDNAAAVIDSFGAPLLSQLPEVAVFLDAEIDNPLHHLYFQGWSEGLIAGGSADSDNPVKFVPCLYAHHNDGQSWSELGKAIAAGAVCGAAWIVFMDSTDFPLGPWQTDRFTGRNMPDGVRVAVAQRILDLTDEHRRTYDFNLVNPAHQDWLLPRLVLPAAPSIT
jgi:hypothetical protein